MSVDLIWEISWKSLPLAAIALLLPALMIRRSAAERASFAHAGMAALLLLPLLVIFTPRMGLLPAPTANPAIAVPAPAPPPPTAALTRSPIALATATNVAAQASVPARTATPTLQPGLGSDWPWIALIYAAPALVLLFTLLNGLGRLTGLRSRAQPITDPRWTNAVQRARKRMAISRSVELLSSTELQSPVSFGLFRPAIVLDPESVKLQPAATEMDALIGHELAHVARYDWVALILSRTVIAMYWFNPLVWLLARRCHQLREEAADDAVLGQSVTGADYASVLVRAARLEQQGRAVLAHGMASGRHSLKLRIHRVLNGHLRRTPARALWSSACALGMLSVAAPLAALAPASNAPAMVLAAMPAAESAAERSEASGVPLQLSWTMRPSKHDPENRVQFSLAYTDGDHQSQNSRPRRWSDFQGIDSSQLSSAQATNIQFSLDAEAGRLTCQGSVSRQAGAGNCEFAPSLSYAKDLQRLGVGEPTQRQQLMLALEDVPLALVNELRRQGYGAFDVKRLVEMGIHGVNVAWLQELDAVGYRLTETRRLVEFRIHGVNADYIRRLAAANTSLRELPPQELVEMRIHGVTPKSVDALARAGYADLPQQRLVEMAIHGATPEFVAELGALGYPGLAPKKLVEMRIHGVTPDFVGKLKRLGYERLEPQQLIEMRIHGVSPTFIQELASLGYRQLEPSQLVQMRIHRVSPEFIREQNANSGRNLPVSRLVEMRIHGA